MFKRPSPEDRKNLDAATEKFAKTMNRHHDALKRLENVSQEATLERETRDAYYREKIATLEKENAKLQQLLEELDGK